jgi:hypothetical protein
MRHAYSAARVAFLILLAAVMARSGFAQLSITNYVITNSQRISVTQWQYTYTAAVMNQGPAVTSVSATLTTTVPNIVVVQGHNVLNFGPVASNGQVEASNTFTINVDRTVAFKLTDLHWSFVTNGGTAPPVANAGPNQVASAGATVTLNGTGSTNPSGIGTLTYSWGFTGVPTGSNTTLMNPNTPTPSFYVDVVGTYTIQLTVSNGTASSSAFVTVGPEIPPVANPGPNQSVALNTLVFLNGSHSSDSNGNTLTYLWTFTQIPNGSNASLTGANTVSPTFTVDVPGKYIVMLVVNDGVENSAPVSVTVSQDSPPVASAGPNQNNASIGTPVHLDGSKSTDVDGDSLTYLWNLTPPSNSKTAVLSVNNIVNPTFTPDVAGTYIAQLIVNDGTYNSSPSTVTITTGGILQAPTANAGPDQKLVPNATVTLDGSASFDPNGLQLTYTWSFTTKPSSSHATLSSPSAIKPTFVGDVSGTYVVQLIVSDGSLTSAAAHVTIAIDTPPVAVAGPNQTVQQHANVLLTGSGSFDADATDTLFYAWTFTQRPAGSSATLSGANTVAPTFVADVAGVYIVQLIVSDSLTSSNPPATVTITAVGPNAITLTPNPLTIGTTTGAGTLTVTLVNPAGSTGQVVTLVSSNTAAAKVPVSVTVPANNTSITVSVTPVAVGTATITASAAGFTSGTTAVNVVAPTATISLDFPQVGLGGQITGHVTLNVPVVNATNVGLNATPSGIVAIPTSVAIPAGGTTASFTITGLALGSTTIRAVVPGYSSASLLVTVIKQPLINLPTSLTVQAGQAAVTLNISLQTPPVAGGPGVTVNLTSSAPTKATVTSSVFIAGGATTPATQPIVTGLALGTVSISASATGYASGSTSVTVTAGPVASIQAGGTPQSVAINTAFAQLTATVEDSLGNPVSGATVVFTAPATAGAPGVTVATTTATTNASGVATANLTSNATAGGPYTVKATSNGFTANYSLTNLSGLPKAVALAATNSGSGQSTGILTAFTNPLRAVVTDSGGNPISGVVVTFTAPTGSVPSGTFAGSGATAQATTDGTGTATSPVFTANGTVSPAGTPYNVKVSVNSNTALTANFALTNLSGPPTQIAATAGATQTTGVTSNFGTQLSATVKDAGGNPASGVTVTFTAPTGAGVTASGSFPNSQTTITAVTNASGVAFAAVPFTANQVAGTYTVTATFTSNGVVSAPANFTLTNTAGSPASISVTGGNNQSVAINSNYAALQATVVDLYNNPVTSGSVIFTVVAAGNGAGAKFNTATTSTGSIANGVATPSIALTANTTVGQFTVKATVTGVTNAAIFTETNTVGPPSTIAIVSGSGQNVQIATAPTTALKVVVKDVGTNVLPNVPVTFTVVPGTNGQGGTFTGNATSATFNTDATGTATALGFTANLKLGSYTVSAAVNSLTTGITLTNTVGTPATVTANNPTLSASINAQFQALSVTVTDAGGNPVAAGTTVVFTVTPASNGASTTVASLSPTTTGTTGVATATFTANAIKGGPYTVTATPTTGTGSATFSLTNNPGPATSITITAGNNQFTPNSTAFSTPLSVTVTDAGGDLLPSLPVTFTIVPGASGVSGSFTSGTTTIQNTNTSGVATALTITANGKIGSFTVTASTPGAGSVTFTLNNQSGPPANPVTLGTGTSGQTVAVNQPFAVPLSATLKDSGGNLAAGFAVTFTVVPGANGQGGNFGGASVYHTTSTSAGVALATAFTANTTAGAYTVVMTVDLFPTVSATFNLTNNPGTASIVKATGGATQNVTVNTSPTTSLQASVTDQYGNPVLANVSVTFTVNPVSGAGGKFGTASLVNVATNSSGVATANTTGSVFTAGTVTGAYTITATTSGASTATFNLTNTAGPANSVSPSASSTGQSTAAGTQFTNLLIATVKDSFGNLVTGQQVLFTAPATGASGTFVGGGTTYTATTDSNGLATSTFFTANATTGAYTVTATINGVTGNFSLTNKAGLAAHIATASNTSPQSSPLTVPFTNLAALVTDSGNNPVSGATVTFTVVPGAGGASATFAGSTPSTVQAVTGSNGVATTTVVLTPNLVLGAFTVNATVTNVSGPAVFALTNVAGPAAHITITSGGGQSAQIKTAFTNPLVVAVTDVAGNPVNTGTVSFTAPSSSALTFADTGTFVTTQPIVNGVAKSTAMTAGTSITTYSVVAAAVNVTGVSVTFSGANALTNTAGQPASLTSPSGGGQSGQVGEPYANPLKITVKDAGGNNVAGATVTFTAVPNNGRFGYFGGTLSATVLTNSSGVATSPTLVANLTLGSFTVTATVTTTVQGVQPASFTETNIGCTQNVSISACPNVTLGAVSVGQNLQVLTPVTLNVFPANVTGNNTFPVTITSSDPTQALLWSAVTGPVPSLTVPFNVGVLQQNVWVVGVGNGTATTPPVLFASGPGYQYGIGSVSLTPSGFVLATVQNGQTQLGGNVVTQNGNTTNMTIYSYQLDSSGNPIAPQSLVGGMTVNLTIQDTNAAVGAVSPTSPISITGPDVTNSGTPVTFNADPVNTGSATLTVTPPTGFGTPTSGTSMIFTVISSSLSVSQGAATIGQSLETTGRVFISGTDPNNDTFVTLTSSDSTQLVFSTSPTTAGKGTITVDIPAGLNQSPLFYIQNISSSPNGNGNVSYTVSSSGFQSLNKPVTLAPSGILVWGPAGQGNTFSTTTESTPSTLTVETDVLDVNLNPVQAEWVAGGLTVTSAITLTDNTVGTINGTPVQIPSGSSDVTTGVSFQPNSSNTNCTAQVPCTATISASDPTGFSTPAQFGSVGVSVTPPGLGVTGQNINAPVSIGMNLQTKGILTLGAAVPAGQTLLVTLTSNDSRLTLSPDPTTVGTSSITLSIPAGGTFSNYYMQALSSSGTVTYTATAPGFTQKSGNVVLSNSGVVVGGPLAPGNPANESVAAGPDSNWTVATALLDSGRHYIQEQSLAAGQTVTANLVSNNTNAGTVPPSVTITGGTLSPAGCVWSSGTCSAATSQGFTFTPVNPGSTTVTVSSSFGVPATSVPSYKSVGVNVKP